MIDIFSLHGKRGLGWFYKTLQVLGLADAHYIVQVASTTMRCLADNGKQAGLKAHLALLKAEEDWYASLAAGEPDYSIYGRPEYLAEVWCCWDHYARKYIKDIFDARKVEGLLGLMGEGAIVDLGNGLGLSTAAFAQLLPLREVIGTNLPGTVQWQFNEYVRKKTGFILLPESELFAARPPVALCFASEYFEHFEKPLEHLQEVLALSPRVMVVANAFGADSMGHFPTYIHEGVEVPRSAIGAKFNGALIKAGYRPVPTKLWNNRPMVMVKQ